MQSVSTMQVLTRQLPTATAMADWPSAGGEWTRRPPLRIQPGQTAAFAMRSSAPSGGCEAWVQYAAAGEAAAAKKAAESAEVTLHWVNPAPQMSGKLGQTAQNAPCLPQTQPHRLYVMLARTCQLKQRVRLRAMV